MPKTKNIPLRMCIACREMKPKAEMTRVVRNADGEISPDPTGKAPDAAHIYVLMRNV